MKNAIFAAALVIASVVSTSHAAKTVTFATVLDTATVTNAGINGSTYVPSTDKFVATHATSIDVLSGTGALEGQLSTTGISPSGLGFYGITATQEGAIYGYEDSGNDLWRWDSVAANPVKVYDTPAFVRVGYTSEIDGKTIVGLTGNAPNSIVEFYTASFPFISGSFSFGEAPNLNAKSSLAFNQTATVAFTVPNNGIGEPIQKYVKTGTTWASTPAWAVNIGGGGPMAYDNVNDLLFVIPMAGTTETLTTKTHKVYALDGATGNVLGSQDLTNITFGTAQYCGGWVTPAGQTGTVTMSARGLVSPSNPALLDMYKWTYIVTPAAGVDDWSLYKQ